MSVNQPGGVEASAAAQVVFLDAVQQHQAGHLNEAERLFQQVLALNPRHADSLHRLGVVAYQTGRHDLAADLISQAITINGNDASYHSNLGLVLQQQGRLEQAVTCYRAAVALNPNQSDAHNNLGNVLGELLRPDEAIACYRRAIDLNPDHLAAYNNLGMALLGQGRLDEATACHRKAVHLKPKSADMHINLGNALRADGRLDEAIASYRSAIDIEPNRASTHNNLGVALFDQRQMDEAIACYRRAIELGPDNAAAHINLGNVLKEQARLKEAVAAYNRAIELSPNDPNAHNNLGVTLLEQGRPDEAITRHRQAIGLDPDHPEAHFNLAMALLARGDLASGFQEYEWRWKTPSMRGIRRTFVQPRWFGEPAAGQTVLIQAEQGLGDTIQFCRFAPMAAARGMRVIMEVPATLVRVLRALPGVDRVVRQGEALPPFDLYCPMLSLPLALRTTIDTIPSATSYLYADAALVAAWRARLAAMENQGPRIGLVWAGDPRKHLPALAAVDRRRSIDPDRLRPLFELKGAHFFSLQKGGPAPPWDVPLTDFMREMVDFADTAALVANLDLIISVDTAVAHLAAALGKPVWLLDRFDPCWRWLVGRNDSPWYPTLRIYRQSEPGDWGSVVATVAQDVKMILAGQAF